MAIYGHICHIWTYMSKKDHIWPYMSTYMTIYVHIWPYTPMYGNNTKDSKCEHI